MSACTLCCIRQAAGHEAARTLSGPGWHPTWQCVAAAAAPAAAHAADAEHSSRRHKHAWLRHPPQPPGWGRASISSCSAALVQHSRGAWWTAPVAAATAQGTLSASSTRSSSNTSSSSSMPCCAHQRCLGRQRWLRGYHTPFLPGQEGVRHECGGAAAGEGNDGTDSNGMCSWDDTAVWIDAASSTFLGAGICTVCLRSLAKSHREGRGGGGSSSCRCWYWQQSRRGTIKCALCIELSCPIFVLCLSGCLCGCHRQATAQQQPPKHHLKRSGSSTPAAHRCQTWFSTCCPLATLQYISLPRMCFSQLVCIMPSAAAAAGAAGGGVG